jgi:hypothetical protein
MPTYVPFIQGFSSEVIEPFCVFVKNFSLSIAEAKMSAIQQASTPKIDALVVDAKAKFLAEFREVADHAAFAPGNVNRPLSKVV